MKRVIPLTACFIAVVCFAQSNSNDDGNANSKQLIKRNHIRQETVYRISFTKDGKEKNPELLETTVYDTTGSATEHTSNFPGTKLSFKTTNFYDAHNRLLKQIAINVQSG